MIGSRAKCRTILDHLKADGITDNFLQRVYAPIGLNLGGPSPEEIAVAILAEVITVRRHGTGKFDRASNTSSKLYSLWAETIAL